MKIKHNKKRNIGLLFAQLSQLVSESMVKGDVNTANRVLNLISKHYKPGTELFKEFRLFSAMVNTAASADSIAGSIINEAKSVSRMIDEKKLTQQKSALIKDINYALNESDFYSRRVADYKIYATIQTLLSEWRNLESDIVLISKFESELRQHLLKDKKIVNLNEMKTPDVNHLVVDIMRKKIEEKFGTYLTADQINLLREYVFSHEDKARFLSEIKKIRLRVLASLDEFSKTCTNKILKEQIPLVRESIERLEDKSIDDEVLSKYLTLMKITEELITGDGSNE